jgi:hypothetical protein
MGVVNNLAAYKRVSFGEKREINLMLSNINLGIFNGCV